MKRVPAAGWLRSVGRPARVTGSGAPTRSFRRAAGESPRLLPPGDIFVAHLQRLVPRQLGIDRRERGGRLGNAGRRRIAARRTPAHLLDVEILALAREDEIHEQ